jgi:hypothetical protein
MDADGVGCGGRTERHLGDREASSHERSSQRFGVLRVLEDDDRHDAYREHLV